MAEEVVERVRANREVGEEGRKEERNRLLLSQGVHTTTVRRTTLLARLLPGNVTNKLLTPSASPGSSRPLAREQRV